MDNEQAFRYIRGRVSEGLRSGTDRDRRHLELGKAHGENVMFSLRSTILDGKYEARNRKVKGRTRKSDAKQCGHRSNQYARSSKAADTIIGDMSNIAHLVRMFNASTGKAREHYGLMLRIEAKERGTNWKRFVRMYS